MMFGLCNQVVIRWFTARNHSDSCGFVAIVAGTKTVLSNSFCDCDFAVSDLEDLIEVLVQRAQFFVLCILSVTVGVCQFCTCIKSIINSS